MFFPTLNPATDIAELAHRFDASPCFLLSKLNFDAFTDLVVASGSIVEGFGNKDSDIDLFIFTPKPERYQNEYWYWKEAKKWIDVIYYPIEKIEELVDQIIDTPVEKNWNNYNTPSLSDMDLYHRLLVSVPLTSPIDGFVSLQGFSRLKLGANLAWSNIVASRARWLDAVGAYRAEQYHQAWYAAGICQDHALDAWCAIHGETNPSPKWRWAKVERFKNNNKNQFRVKAFMAPNFPDEPLEAAEHILSHTGRMLFQVMHQMVFGRFPTLDMPNTPGERYEILSGEIYHLSIDGFMTHLELKNKAVD